MTDVSLFSIGKRFFRFITISTLFAFMFTLSQIQPAHAEGTVTDCSAFNDGNEGDGVDTLGEAIESGGTVTFACSGTITVPAIPISNTVTINAGGQNVALDGGGANRIFAVDTSGNLTLNNITLQNAHSATGFGGGILNRGLLTINNSTLSGNSVPMSGNPAGGAIYNFNTGTVAITNSTFSGNSADNGGGIMNYGTLTITNSTFSGNNANYAGGVLNYGGTINLSNSIVTGNSGDDCLMISSGMFNLTGPNLGCGGSVTGDARLGTFNGRYYPLLSASAAIDAGDNATCASTDQLGAARPFNGGKSLTCDLGAIEVQVATPNLSINDVLVNEGNSSTTTATLTVSLSSPAPAGGVTFDIATADNIATAADNDYVAQALTAQTIPEGESSYTFTVTVNGDTKYDNNETFYVNVTNVVAAFVSDAQGQIGILNDDPQPSLSINDITLNEGDSGTTAFTFTITQSTVSYETVTVTVASSDITTFAGSDYQAISSGTSLSFPANTTTLTQTVTVLVNGDYTVESDELFAVSLIAASNATISDGQGVGTITNDDVAGIVVTPTTGLFTSEAGSTASFNVRLTSQPTADVTINLTSSDTSEGSVPASVTIPAASWQTGMDVTITGLEDLIADGSVLYTIVLTASSGDSLYNVINPDDVSVTNTDDDTGGLSISPTSLTTTEAGGTATFSVVLNTEPTAEVTVDLSGVDATEGTISDTAITFTTLDWNAVQTVTITGVDDSVADGDIPYTIVTTIISADSVYNAINPDDVSITNADDDTPGITVSPTSLTTTEAGSAATFAVVLDSQPTADVVVTLTGDDPTEGTLSAAALTFTPLDWNIPQTITVTGVDDSVDDGDVTYTLVTTLSSGDILYVSIDPDDVIVTNTDNDAAGVTITPTSLQLPESATQTYQIDLASVPSSPVTIAITFDPIQLAVNGSSVSPVLLTIADGLPQSVSVTTVPNSSLNSGRSTLITHTITSGAPEYPVGMALPAVTVTIDDVPPPPPTPLCEDHNFADGGVVRSSTVDGIDFAVNCRILYQNGAPTQWLGGDLYNGGSIGIEGVLNLGVQQAVDIFSPTGLSYFSGGAVFCLRGEGTLIWLAASGVPRHAEIIGSYTVPEFSGFTCATLFEPGTFVLVTRNPMQ